MKRAIVKTCGLVAALLLLGFAAFAHHGGSDYDVQHPVTLKGTVTEFYWSNPHCQIFVDVKDDSQGGETLPTARKNTPITVSTTGGLSNRGIGCGSCTMERSDGLKV